MITVAQRTTAPLIPAPRGRFAALTVGVDSQHLVALTPRLRTLGASAVHAARTARGGVLPHPGGSHDVGVLDVPVSCVRDELHGLQAAGWRRVVVIAPRVDAVGVAIGGGARGAVVPPTRPAAAAPAVPPRPHRGPDEAREGLSEREIQVLQAVAEGHSNKQIGVDLCLSALTVKSHLARIGRKLGTGERAEMVAIGMRAGVIE
ncbi:MAG: helix-turn-helix transcriptional regulator [Candidatus Nanopelagicales bacterium]|nr:helix-turn-helix transcriptional regulator [Candidatus Nanopelagicales bacterium]